MAWMWDNKYGYKSSALTSPPLSPMQVPWIISKLGFPIENILELMFLSPSIWKQINSCPLGLCSSQMCLRAWMTALGSLTDCATLSTWHFSVNPSQKVLLHRTKWGSVLALCRLPSFHKKMYMFSVGQCSKDVIGSILDACSSPALTSLF